MPKGGSNAIFVVFVHNLRDEPQELRFSDLNLVSTDVWFDLISADNFADSDGLPPPTLSSGLDYQLKSTLPETIPCQRSGWLFYIGFWIDGQRENRYGSPGYLGRKIVGLDGQTTALLVEISFNGVNGAESLPPPFTEEDGQLAGKPRYTNIRVLSQGSQAQQSSLYIPRGNGDMEAIPGFGHRVR
jgi:hypothetical protein